VAAPHLASCNPPVDRPATRLRWCFATGTPVLLTLVFLGDSLVQIGFGYWEDSTLLNASAHWRQRADTLVRMLGRPPDSTVAKPVSDWKGIDPRGDSAQVFMAYWRATPARRWCAGVFILDLVGGFTTSLTRISVDVYTAVGPPSACDRAGYH